MMVKVSIVRIHPLIRNVDVTQMRDIYVSSYLKYRENPKLGKILFIKIKGTEAVKA